MMNEYYRSAKKGKENNKPEAQEIKQKVNLTWKIREEESMLSSSKNRNINEITFCCCSDKQTKRVKFMKKVYPPNIKRKKARYKEIVIHRKIKETN